MDPTNTYLNLMPATPPADSNKWRITIGWHEHVHKAVIDVHDPKARGDFIREWCEICGLDMDFGLWIYGGIDLQINEWMVRTDEIKALNERVDLLCARADTQDRTIEELRTALANRMKVIEAMEAKFASMREWVIERTCNETKGNGKARDERKQASK
jgi:uncharacterized coiled-coil protein SlyX